MKKHEFYWKLFEQPKRKIEGFIDNLLKRDNAYLIQKFVNKHRNEIMLDHFRLVRLLGWTKDQYDDDYYYIIDTRIQGIGNKVSLYSCCGGFIPIKKKLKKFDYYYMDYVWSLNDCSIQDGRKRAEKKGYIIK